MYRVLAEQGFSESAKMNLPRKFWWRLWHDGIGKAFEMTVSRLERIIGISPRLLNESGTQIVDGPEVLNLVAGQLVEVKSEQAILATLDDRGRFGGLHWMPQMTRFCGQRVRVFKRVERILLESTGEYRNVKNTVLLENVLCDGKDFYGCGRSCFHFWREAWLKPVEAQEERQEV
jgi:hypothetical protein